MENLINDIKSNIDTEQILQVSNFIDLLLQHHDENVNMEEKVNAVCGNSSKVHVSAGDNRRLIITNKIQSET